MTSEQVLPKVTIVTIADRATSHGYLPALAADCGTKEAKAARSVAARLASLCLSPQQAYMHNIARDTLFRHTAVYHKPETTHIPAYT